MNSGLARNYLLDTQCDLISRGMELRRPQRESLEAVHNLLKRLPYTLRDAPPDQLARDLREFNPQWTFTDGFADFTFALATGVGKTRLMGALIAYLARTGMSRDFVILAPRQAILRKLEEECRASSAKYIFGNTGVLPEPHICHRGNLLEFDPRRPGLTGAIGPNVFILSPQLLTTGKHVFQRSAYSRQSIADYLQAQGDLVVLVDESHHISDSAADNEDRRSWRSALVALKPKLVFAMTATPRDTANGLYTYDLRRCLRDGLYTKAPRLIVDDQGGRMDGDAYDAFTLRTARSRLIEKTRCMQEMLAAHPGRAAVKPVMLVCAHDVSHADRAAEWLRNEGGFGHEEILVIHSKRKTEQDLANLAEIENPLNPVRVVVQVHVLDEGWDVSNVYVIATLRNVNSYTNGRQVMGRGLRLPWRRRIGDPELDGLDVLAFGQQTIEQIIKEAEADYGGSVDVVRANAIVHPGIESTIADGTGTAEASVTARVARSEKIADPLVDMVPAEPDLAVRISVSCESRQLTALELGRNETMSVVGDFSIDKGEAVRVVVEEVTREFTGLSYPLHEGTVENLATEYFARAGETSSRTTLDPFFVAKDILEQLGARYASCSPSYIVHGVSAARRLLPAEMRVPTDYVPYEQSDVVWDPGLHPRLPFQGWRRSVTDLARFDTQPEFEMAKRLDRMSGVKAWFRNDPPQFRLPTSRGMHSPDFVIWKQRGDVPEVLLLEVKGEHLYSPETAAVARARDIRLIAEALKEAGYHLFETALVLGADVDAVRTLEQIRSLDATRKTQP